MANLKGAGLWFFETISVHLRVNIIYTPQLREDLHLRFFIRENWWLIVVKNLFVNLRGPSWINSSATWRENKLKFVFRCLGGYNPRQQ